MIRICAWCKTVLGVKDGAEGGVTHGICQPCAARMEAEAAQFRQQEEQLMPSTTFKRDKPPTLEEAQAAVGGYVQMLTLEDGSQMLIDEEGRIKRLPVNESASIRAREFGPIVGNVLILEGPARWLDNEDEEDTDVSL